MVDECHRGSADADSAWRKILDYFEPAIQIGNDRHPQGDEVCLRRSTTSASAVYTYSLKQGIDDGFLAPFKVIRVDLDHDALGWRPEAGEVDDAGVEIEDRIYNQTDFDTRHSLSLTGIARSPTEISEIPA